MDRKDIETPKQTKAQPTMRLARAYDQNKVMELFKKQKHFNGKPEHDLVNGVFTRIKNATIDIKTYGTPHFILVLENENKEIIGAVAFNDRSHIYAIVIDPSKIQEEQVENYGKLLVSGVAKFASCRPLEDYIKNNANISSYCHTPFTEANDLTGDGFWSILKFTQGKYDQGHFEMCCNDTDFLCKYFEENKQIIDKDYFVFLSNIQSGNPQSLQDAALQLYEGYKSEDKKVEALKTEILKHFSADKGTYTTRMFGIRHDNQSELLNKVNMLISSNKSFDQILTELISIGTEAQNNHETVSGWKNPITGNLINEVCGFKAAVNTIVTEVEVTKSQQPSESNSSRGQKKY